MMISSNGLTAFLFAIFIWPFIAGFIATFCISKKMPKSFGSLLLSIVGNSLILVVMVRNYAFFEQYGDGFGDKAFMFFAFVFPVVVTVILCTNKSGLK